jgi:hypothetical protein
MAKKAGKKYSELDFDPYDDADDLFGDAEPDDSELAREIYSTDWDDDSLDAEERFSARRKIERRKDMRKLYSQLDEFEEFGDRADW